MTNADQYAPVPFDPAAYARKRCASDPAFKVAYQALADEFSVLDQLLRARKAAGLSQAEVAARMGIAPASLARIEASASSLKHAPSLATLRKYAAACGLRLSISVE